MDGSSIRCAAAGLASVWVTACSATDVVGDLLVDRSSTATDAAVLIDAAASIDAVAPVVVSDAAAAPSDAAGADDAAAPIDVQDGGLPGRVAWCAGRAALPTVRADGRQVIECATALAARSFTHAICACHAIVGTGTVSTQSAGVSGAPAADAAIAIGGSTLDGWGLPPLQVGGSLIISGPGAMLLSGPSLDVAGDLRSSAPLGTTSETTSLRIARDAWLPSSSALEPAALVVGRDLYLGPLTPQPVDARWSAAEVGGQTRRGDLAGNSPCPCGPAARLDVEATVEWASRDNDNEALGFDIGLLAAVAEPTTRSLPCGRYYAPVIDGTGVLTLHISGPVALFVGDVRAWIEVELEPGATLDLFASGLFEPRGGILGDRTRPSATRIYIHDQPAPGPLNMFGEVASNFYAPTVGVQTLGLLRHGAMVVRDLFVSNSLTVRYDPAIADPGSCGVAEGQACEGAGDCAGGLACVDARCSSCGADAECGSPFECSGGRCGALAL